MIPWQPRVIAALVLILSGAPIGGAVARPGDDVAASDE